jgi:carbon-monoxide dehydrogenase small subunit
LIALAIPTSATRAIRNRGGGTLGGSIAFADPAGRAAGVPVALGGEVEIAVPRGKRTVKAGDFFKGLFETALGAGDVLTAIRIPAARRRRAWVLPSSPAATATTPWSASPPRAGRRQGLGDVRLAYFGVGNVPLRAQEGRDQLTEGNIDDAVQALDADLDPSDDVQATGATKKHLAGVLLRRVASSSWRRDHERARCDITLTVNGETVVETVDARKTWSISCATISSLTGSHVGCEHGVCGACTVRVDGVIVRGCLMLAAQCDGANVETIEGVSDAGEIADLQKASNSGTPLQCGFCTPGMLLTAQELLRGGGVPSREKIREQISGNYCRCTGYHAIVDAIRGVAEARAGGKR